MNTSAGRGIPIGSGKAIVGGCVALALQFGLAIAGWGGWSAFFAHPALQALTWLSVVLIIVSFFSGGGLSTGEKEDRGNRWVLAAFGIIGLLIAYFPAYTDRIEFWTLDGDGLRWAGVGICAAGSILRIWPVFVLRNRFSGLVAIQEGHKLETRGIYSIVRNPSYLGLMVGSLGWVLAFRSGVGLILTASLLWPLVERIRAEERLLREHFGADYEEYCAHTWRLVPGIY